MVEQMGTADGKAECIHLGWLSREASGREPGLLGESVAIISQDEIARKRENELAETHFTVTARKAVEVNEGGLIDPNE